MVLRKYISAFALFMICTTILFAAMLIREVCDLQHYMEYVAENGKSAIFHEESINFNIATHLSREFHKNKHPSPTTDQEGKARCQTLEHVGNIYGFNLLKKGNNNLDGTLQTRNKNCNEWVGDINALSYIHLTENTSAAKYSLSNHTDSAFNNVRYYIDLDHRYIYISGQANTREYTFNNWLLENNDTINIARNVHTIAIDDNMLNDLRNGEHTLSHIHQDEYTRENIISMIAPVFSGDALKGIFITDINIDDLVLSFKTIDRPLLWKFLSLYITNNETGRKISFHEPYIKSYNLISHQDALTPYYTLHVKLDAIYVIIANIWLFTLYILGQNAYKQFINHESLSRDNVTDAMTGLYNRKVITPELKQKLRSLVNKNIPITIIAIDSDGLKKINDTLGHHMGDKAIQLLGEALGNTIRKMTTEYVLVVMNSA